MSFHGRVKFRWGKVPRLEVTKIVCKDQRGQWRGKVEKHVSRHTLIFLKHV